MAMGDVEHKYRVCTMKYKIKRGEPNTIAYINMKLLKWIVHIE